MDCSGNLFIADTANESVRRVDGATGIITTVAGKPNEGISDPEITRNLSLLDSDGVKMVGAHGRAPHAHQTKKSFVGEGQSHRLASAV